MPKQKDIQGYRNPIPTTDIIIEYTNGQKQGIVLIERRNPPYGIAIPGGFAEFGISLEENAVKEGLEETGLEKIIIQNPEKPLCVHSNPKRDPRYHMISICYIAEGYGELKKGVFDDAKDPTLYSSKEIFELIKNKKLVFDHERILLKYLKHIKYLK